jgi:hypothetical protein
VSWLVGAEVITLPATSVPVVGATVREAPVPLSRWQLP